MEGYSMDNAYMQYIVVVIDNEKGWPEASCCITCTQGDQVTSALRGPDAVPATNGFQKIAHREGNLSLNV